MARRHRSRLDIASPMIITVETGELKIVAHIHPLRSYALIINVMMGTVVQCSIPELIAGLDRLASEKSNNQRVQRTCSTERF